MAGWSSTDPAWAEKGRGHREKDRGGYRQKRRSGAWGL